MENKRDAIKEKLEYTGLITINLKGNLKKFKLLTSLNLND